VIWNRWKRKKVELWKSSFSWILISIVSFKEFTGYHAGKWTSALERTKLWRFFSHFLRALRSRPKSAFFHFNGAFGGIGLLSQAMFYGVLPFHAHAHCL